MTIAGGDLLDVRPGAHIALPVAIISHRDHCVVRLNPHRVK